MYGFAKRLTSFVVAGAVVLGILSVYPKITNSKSTVSADDKLYDSASAINYATILGGAVDYGVVADRIIQNSHTETTFATNYFVHNDFNIDVDYIQSTALFIVGRQLSSENDNPYSHPNVHFEFGYTTASAIYLEAPSAVYGPSTAAPYFQHSINYDPSRPTVRNLHNGNVWFGSGFTDIPNEIPLIQAVNENAYSNVDRLINRICSPGKVEDAEKGWSYFLQDRATDSRYVLNPDGQDCPQIIKSNSYVTIDLTDPSFDGKVVYLNINAKNGLISYLQQSEGFRIKKNESSVVVINIQDDAYTGEILNMKRPSVEVNGTTYTGDTTSNGGDAQAPEVQKYYNESIIWNIMETSKVELDNFGGAILVPAASNVRLSDGNTSGWLVTKGTFNMDREFHFLYSGSSDDKYGQMHFALTKAFTQEYAAHGSVVQDTSVDIADGEYKFYIQEYERENPQREFEKPYGEPKEVSVTKEGTVTFDKLTFTCIEESPAMAEATRHYNIAKPNGPGPAESRHKMFFFRIYEGTSNNKPKRISNSDGYIDVRLRVEVDRNGNFTYFVDYKSVTGKDPATGENIVFRQYGEDYDQFIKMSGVQFDLGAFYNLVKPITVDISKRDVNKKDGDEVEGAVLKVTYVGDDTDMDISGVTLKQGDVDVTDSATREKDSVTFTSGTEQTSIIGLKPGTYKLEETTAPDGYAPQTTTIYFTVDKDGIVKETSTIDSDVGFIEDKDTVVILDEMYRTNFTIKKVDSSYQEVVGAILTLTAQDDTVDFAELGVTATQGGNPAEKLTISGNTLSFETVSGSDTEILNVPDGVYTLSETTVPDGYEQADDQTITIKDGQVVNGNSIQMVDATSTPTATPTVTTTPTVTATPTVTTTPTVTATPTVTSTPTVTATPTITATATPTATVTATATPTATVTATATPTATATATATATPTATATATATATPTATATATATATPTATATATATATPTATATATATATPTATATATATATPTATATATATATPTATATATATATPTATATATATATPTATATATATATPTATATTTATATPTATATATATATPTATATATATATPTATATATATATPTATATATATATPTATATATATATPTATATATATPTATATATATATPTATATTTATATPTATATATATATPTATATVTATATPTATATATATVTPTATATATATATPTNTDTPTGTPTGSPTITDAPTGSPTAGPTITDAPTGSPTAGPTITDAPTGSPTAGPTITDAPTGSPTAGPTITDAPTGSPTAGPTITDAPTGSPTAGPTITDAPTGSPTAGPTITDAPTGSPTAGPTITVTTVPTLTSTPTNTGAPVGPGLDIVFSKEDVAGKEIPKAELTFTSLNDYDLSNVVVLQNGAAVTVELSEDKHSIKFNTVDDSMSIISGLMPGRYKLEETVTPEAYLTAEAIVFDLLADGSADCGNGKVIVKGSPVIMVDKADPSYVISSGRTPIPATGEHINPASIVGIIALFLALCFISICVYRGRKYKD